MVICVTKFTPEVLLSAPRYGPAIPNHDGTLALFTVSQYSFETKEQTHEIRVLDLKTSQSKVFTNDENAHDALWLGDGTNAIIWLQSGAKSITSIMIGDGDHPEKASYTADVILAPFKDLKLTPLKDGTIAVAMSGTATPSGSLWNEETDNKSPSSARIYDKLIVRFWDRYLTPERNVIWYSKLSKSKDKYSLAVPVHNALKGTNFECPFYNPLGSGLDDFDISPHGILFVSLDPDQNLTRQSISNVYFVSLETFEEEKAPSPKILKGKFDGKMHTPRFSPDGKRVVFLQTTDSQDDTDSRIMLIDDITKSLEAKEILSDWHLSPSGLGWSSDGEELLITADDCGRVALYTLSPTPYEHERPKALVRKGVVTSAVSLGKGKELLVSSNSLIESSLYSRIDTEDSLRTQIVYSASKNGKKFGLKEEQVSEIYFKGAEDNDVQAWVIKPSNFQSHKKYPLAFLVHGGPQDAWRSSWSTRWNPAVWAEQGYVVVMPNPTGSTGFGKAFTRAIWDEWGGKCYIDLVKCFEHVKKTMEFIDTDRAIMAGGSFGGYMANWIQGNPLGREFKCIVSHDGLFNLQMMLAGDLIDNNNEFGGYPFPWDNAKGLERYNPARPDLLKEWKTPMLIIHSDKDYRCDFSGGLAAFQTCQALGVESRFLNYPDEGHWVLKPENSLVWHKTVFDWINKFSGITEEREEEELARLTGGIVV